LEEVRKEKDYLEF